MMKKLLMTTAAAVLAATFAHAQATGVDSLVQQLQDQGYTRIEVKVGPTQIKAEAIMGTTKREFIYDRATGELLKSETETVDSEDDTTPGVEVKNSREDFLDDDSSDDDSMDDNSDDDHSGSGSDDDDSDDDEDDDDDDHSGHGGGGSGSNDDD